MKLVDSFLKWSSDIHLNYFRHGVITKLTAFSLNFENELVFSEFNDFASTYVFKTHTSKFMTLNMNGLSSITIMLTMTNDNNIASKFIATIRILFVFGRIMVSIIRIRPNSKDPLFGTALVPMSILHACRFCAQ